ncbi:MAG TPA: substrate-binding domain-containing protein [Gaiellaceae bacterium]|nr:substrate-binding domain-containing protein [Gaiellaceae bacterium]
MTKTETIGSFTIGRRLPVAVLAVAAAALVGAGIGLSGTARTQVASAPAAAKAGGFTIGLILPDVFVPRYETKDKPFFEKKLKQLCPDCKLLYANAAGDQGKEQEQATSMLTQGVDVLVVDPVDGVAAASIVAAAKAKEVPVIAYDRYVKSPDLSFVVSNDYVKVGTLQATAVVNRLKAKHVSPRSGGILMLYGSATDNNALSMKRGADRVIKTSPYKILASIQTWDPDLAQKFVTSQVTRFGHKIIGIYSANDGNAGGAISALKAAGWKEMPPISGLDATVQAMQSILAGDQYQSTYNAFRTEAERAAAAAYALAQGKKPAANAKYRGIPAFLNPPKSVTFSTIASTVIADKFYKPADICTRAYTAACRRAGIIK